jgi:peptide/nickel transport system substrate-binding protein
MRNAATPTAEMVGPGVRGFQPDMNKRLPYDVEARRSCLPTPAIRTASRSA